jgi:multiple sugar transport system permease protein
VQVSKAGHTALVARLFKRKIIFLRRESMKPKMSKAQKDEAKWGWLFVAPTMLGLIILNFYPIFNTIYQSFFKTGDFGKGNTFIGLGNFTKLMADGAIWQAFWNTIKYAIIEVPFGVAIALVLAVFLNKKLPGTSVYRTIFFMPMVCAPAAVAMVWKWLYNTQFGLINNIFHTQIQWISNPSIAWISIGVIGVWSIIGYNMVLFISGLQEIPGDYYEAASIDGATGIRQFFYITIPLLSPTTFFIVQTRVIGALTVFDLMFMVMDKTNVALNKVQSVVYLFYDYSFTKGNKGMGSALVCMLLIFIMIITVILQKVEKTMVYHN